MHDRIESNPLICHGKPVIRGTRVMVSVILGCLAGGDSAEIILADYPTRQHADIAGALAFASDLSQFENVPMHNMALEDGGVFACGKIAA